MQARVMIIAALSAATFATGCTDPRDLESPPVTVETAKGAVTCQLYTPRLVLWDRAVDRPDTMTVQEADDICRAEGKRQKSGA